jgi:hypothetical protein
VIALLDGIADDHGARTADLVLAIIRSMCNWYQSRNDDYTSPVVRGMVRAKPGERARRRILTTTKSARSGRRAPTWARSARSSKSCC